MTSINDSIIFYGERGLVNGIVLDMQNNVEALKKFLQSIHFCGGTIPAWTDKVRSVSYFIEPSFAEFGNPDLMILCDCSDEKHLIFIEAKVSSYIENSIDIESIKEYIDNYKDPNQSKSSSVFIGINSKINSQLTLRYRLSRVLKTRKRGSALIEDSIWQKYFTNSLDFVFHPRRMMKNLNIKLCDDYFMDITDFWFVALTADEPNAKPYDNMSTRPYVLNSNGVSHWEEINGHFGFVSYRDLNNIFSENGYYQQAKHYSEVKFGSNKSQNLSLPRVKPENWDKFDLSVSNNLCFSLTQLIKESIKELCLEHGDNRYEHYDCIKNNGSFSFKAGGVTVISIFPQRQNGGEGITLALRTDHFDNTYKDKFPYGPFLFGAANKKEFIGRFINESISETEKSEVQYIIKEYWKNLFD